MEKGEHYYHHKVLSTSPHPEIGGSDIWGKKLSNADKLALVKLSAKLSISKNRKFEIIEKLSILENASNLSDKFTES